MTQNPGVTTASDDAVTEILTTAPVVALAAGCDLLNSDLTVAADLSPWLDVSGSSVSSNVAAAIHRTCNLTFDMSAPLPVEPMVRPYIKLTNTDTGASVRYNLGVYLLASPSPDNTYLPATSSFEGYDLLQVLNQPIGDSISVDQGDDLVAAAAAIIGEAWEPAFVNYTYLDPNNPPLAGQPYTWAIGSDTDSTTYLSVVNTILSAAGFLPVWVDWNGYFQLTPYDNPGTEPPVWAFDYTNSQTNLDEARTSSLDLFDVPNWWRFIQNNLTSAPEEGVTQFTYEDDISSTGVGARGRLVRKVVYSDAADYPTLVTSAVQQIETDLLPAEQYNLTGFPNPTLWHRDIVTYSDPNTVDQVTENGKGVTVRTCMVVEWTLSLDAENDETFVLQTVTPVIDDILTAEA